MGTVEFGIQYLSESQKLVVDLVRVLDLPAPPQHSHLTNGHGHGHGHSTSVESADVFCKCTLLPDKLSFQSKAVKRSSNPIFEQQFEFDYLEMSKMDARFLEISIHELDKDDCLGVATLKLNLPNIETKNMFLRDFKPYIKTEEV